MSRLRVLVAFVAVLFRSLSRDRSALFFMLALPVIVMVIIGAAFGGPERIQVGVVVLDDSAVAADLVDRFDATDGLTTVAYPSVEAAREGIRRQDVPAAVVLPAGLGASLLGPEPATIGFISRSSDQNAFTARAAVTGVLDGFGARIAAAQSVSADGGANFDDALAAALDEGPSVDVPVEATVIGGGEARDLSRFSLVAPQNLVLFVFITSLSGGAYLVTVRRAGVLRRVASTPTGTGTLLSGVAVGWFSIALAESALILTVGAVAFGVDWGDPVAAAVLVATFAAVSASAGLLIGALGHDEDRVGSVAPIIGIVLGALGGCMVPIEVFPAPMLAIAHAIPQFWAVQAWQQLIFDGADLGAIAGPILVLLAFAVALLGTATMALRRQL